MHEHFSPPVNPNFKKMFAAPWSAVHYSVILMKRHNLIPLKFVRLDTEDHDNDFVSHARGPVTSKLHCSFRRVECSQCVLHMTVVAS